MDLSQIFNSPNFEQKMFEILDKWWEAKKAKPVDVNIDIEELLSEPEASLLLTGKVLSKTAMYNHRVKGLKYQQGKPVTYLREHVLEYREKLNIERKNKNG